MTSPIWKFAMLASWLEGYAEGLPDHHEIEKIKIKEAAVLLMKVYESKIKENDAWKTEINDQA